LINKTKVDNNSKNIVELINPKNTGAGGAAFGGVGVLRRDGRQ
jgi:hypothetical protein